MLGDEDGDDREEVVGEFALEVAGCSVGTVFLVENHEFDISLSEDPLDELQAEAREAVSVGHHDFRDISRVHAFQ